MNKHLYRQLISEASDFLRARIARAREEFGIGDFEEYHYDLKTGRFWWSEGGVPQVEARMVVVGSISTISKTWLWAWANTQLHGLDQSEIECVRRYGIQRDLPPLVDPTWTGDEVDGWEMTALSARLLESSAAYRSPSANGALFLLLHHLRRVVPNERRVQ